MDKRTQTAFVLDCLKQGKTVTSLTMFEHKITRLSAIIYNLRHTYNLNILTFKKKSKNGKYYAEYKLFK